MISKTIVFAVLFIAALSIRSTDKVNAPPGMLQATMYSGYLKTLQQGRQIHYLFVEAQQTPNTKPLVIWLNGGPGCSSLIGFSQQIGPYIIGNTYEHGQNITRNPNRWNRAANLLFLQSPAIVGFSTDTDKQFQYSDEQTANDAFAALQDFISTVAPQFSNRKLFITGQSYAGKYIPDITTRIIDHNRNANNTYINLGGILVGNGVMNFEDQSLLKSSIQFMIDHDFFSQRLLSVYKTACERDFQGPRCKYFRYEFNQLRKDINHYNVYEVCNAGQQIQAIKLKDAVSQIYSKTQSQIGQKFLVNGQNLKVINQCPSDKGMIDYWNFNKYSYNVNTKVATTKNWTVCADLKYRVEIKGSMQQYASIFLNKAVKVWLFNGDWDDVVPYPDTQKNLNTLRRKKSGSLQPWFVGETHAGFYQVYDSLTVITVKGASHMVPQTKPVASYQMFYNFINDRPINTPV